MIGGTILSRPHLMKNIGHLTLLILLREFQGFLFMHLKIGKKGLNKGRWNGKTSLVEVKVFSKIKPEISCFEPYVPAT